MNTTEKTTWFVIAMILALAFAWSVVVNYYCGRPAPIKDVMITKSTSLNVKRGLTAYFEEYGHFPIGANSNMMKVLAGGNIEGQNPKQLTFLHFADKKRYNDKVEVVDSWSKPIVFKSSGDGNLVIYSVGENGVDDGGKLDDIALVISPP